MKRWLAILCLVLGSGTIAADLDNFVLPDLFVTAKDLTQVSIGRKVTVDTKPLFIRDFKRREVDDFYAARPDIIAGAPLNLGQTNPMYNEITVYLGLPSAYQFQIYHAYQIAKIPYVVGIKRFQDKHRYASGTRMGGEVLAAIQFDPSNVMDLYFYQNQVIDADLQVTGLGLNSSWTLPFEYRGGIVNANAYAGNASLSLLSNRLGLDIGDIELLGDRYPSKVQFILLNSPQNAYQYLDLVMHKKILFWDLDHHIIAGLQGWSNKSGGSGGFLLKDRVQLPAWNSEAVFEFGSKPVDIYRWAKTDFVEMDDTELKSEERVALRVTVNDVLEDTGDVFSELAYYTRMNVLDDLDNDHYYSIVNREQFWVMWLGFDLPELWVGDIPLSIRVQMPFSTIAIPNWQTPLALIKHQRNVWGGDASVELAYYGRELSKSVGSVQRDGFFDLSAQYMQQISREISWDISVRQLLSAGAEWISGRKLGSSQIIGRIRVIF